LNVIAITCPRLSDLQGDVPLLVDHFLDVHCRKDGKPRMTPTRQALDALIRYDWPGDLLDHASVIERAVEHRHCEDLGMDEQPACDLVFALGTPLKEIELRVIKATLEHTRGDKQLAAQLLGISARTIYRKLDA